MEKDIDKLLRLLDENPYGIQLGQILYNKKIDRSVIRKAKNMGYVRLFNDDTNKECTDIIGDLNFCRITPEGSQTLNRYGGFENILKYDRKSRIIAKAALTVATISAALSFCALIITILIALI
jgi:hypothetical protein